MVGTILRLLERIRHGSGIWVELLHGSILPHLAISEEDPNVMYVVSSLVSPGEADEVDGSYPEWTIDLNVMKSEDGGYLVVSLQSY